MSPTQLSARPQRRLLCLALLTVLASPAFAGDNCQLVDSTGVVLPIDSTSTGDKALACGPYASATGDSAVAVGEKTSASGRNATAVGSWIDLDGDSQVDPDEITWAKGMYATAIGAAAQALGNASTVLGIRAVATDGGRLGFDAAHR